MSDMIEDEELEQIARRLKHSVNMEYAKRRVRLHTLVDEIWLRYETHTLEEGEDPEMSTFVSDFLLPGLLPETLEEQ